MKRLVALVVAVGLVVGAVFVRRAIDDGGDQGGQAGDPTSRTTVAPTTGRTLCASDLGRVCDRFGETVTKESPAETLARLVTTGRLDADAWITSSTWADLASYKAPGTLDKPGPALASTPLAFFVTGADAAAVSAACPTLEWRCLATHDSVKVAFDDPTRTTAGLLTVVQQAATFFGSTDFGTNNFSQFELDLAKLKRNSPIKATSSAFTDNGLLNFAAAGVVTALAADGDELAATAQFAGKTSPAPAPPAIAADVVVVTSPGQRSPLAAGDVREKLFDAGYRASVPGAARIPAADVLDQLQLLWTRLS